MNEGADEAPLPGGERGWGEGGIRHRAPAGHTHRARSLRHEATDAERKFWGAVRAGRLNGWKFRRQVPIGRYIVDFACPAGRLIVELDGSQHAEQRLYDAARTHFLQSQGYRVMRFWNNEFLTNFEGAMSMVSHALTPHHPLPNPSPLQGEGL
ncbi:endonuclease domain-containing protein [Sphingoaurantiacus capsulatus]|uniref:Endonuclease domain-containing protein n=1 Tax=Sphingoaurantiacus capsulatus TaxID=1771310 RepID=A0ABV7XBJ1_9SPHN